MPVASLQTLALRSLKFDDLREVNHLNLYSECGKGDIIFRVRCEDFVEQFSDFFRTITICFYDLNIDNVLAWAVVSDPEILECGYLDEQLAMIQNVIQAQIPQKAYEQVQLVEKQKRQLYYPIVDGYDSHALEKQEILYDVDIQEASNLMGLFKEYGCDFGSRWMFIHASKYHAVLRDIDGKRRVLENREQFEAIMAERSEMRWDDIEFYL